MKLSNNLTLEQRMNTEWGYQFDPMQCAEILDGAQFDDYILEDCLEVDKLIAAYDVLCRRNGLMRLDEWAKHVIYEEAPYYVTHKGEPIDETSKQSDN